MNDIDKAIAAFKFSIYINAATVLACAIIWVGVALYLIPYEIDRAFTNNYTLTSHANN